MQHLEVPDESVVREAQGGSREAAAELVRRYERIVLTVALARTRNRAAAEDVAQECWARALERLHQVRDPARIGQWLMATVVHLARDADRRTRVTRQAMTHVGPAAPAETGERHEAILRAIAELDDDARTVVMLRFMENMSYPAIAELMDVPFNRVKWLIQSTFLNLRDNLRGQR